MTKMVHKDGDNPIRSIDHQGRVYTADDQGSFDVQPPDVDVMKQHHGLVEKDQPLQK